MGHDMTSDRERAPPIPATSPQQCTTIIQVFRSTQGPSSIINYYRTRMEHTHNGNNSY